MRFNKRNIRRFVHGYLDTAAPTTFQVFIQNKKTRTMAGDVVRLMKEYLVATAVFIVATELAIGMLSIPWVLDLPAWMFLLIPFLIFILLIPVVQSPRKCAVFIWNNYIPDGDEQENAKPKRIMSITDDGEVEEVYEGEAFPPIEEKRTIH